ncbi:unnamed protein product [Adineta steineri]|uniref:Uncharacterized protein n=1 Tax=Adineta steineri TaxID=433720 RepID=A0A814ZJP9_9BILA|nr:unnamed protein product [Adineta steineri]CAF1382775.1 unnamed protein product [Adineta steineri]CAF1463943.1 unnamed protein product [Adineta steineri]CAF1633977.1 unnamed protein product [Adineta steineri]
MEANQHSNTANQSTDGYLSDITAKKNKYNILQSAPTNTSDEPRSRSHSIKHWFSKNLTNITTSHGSHEESFRRQRANTTTQHGRHSPPPSSFPSVNRFANISEQRQRSSTMDSITSSSKKVPRPKKILTATDQQVQQAPSVFQFMLGR